VVNLRLLGIGSRQPVEPLRPLFRIMWVGFWVNLVTGSLLFAADAGVRGTSVLFLAKMAFVALGVATVVMIKRAVFDGPADRASAARGKRLALLSLLAWTVAITFGRLLAYV
jgi:hypothetical protein